MVEREHTLAALNLSLSYLYEMARVGRKGRKEK